VELFTSRWQNRDLAHLDCTPLGISRGLPRWKLPYRYRMMRSLAPSREAFAIEDAAEFERVYVAGLEEIGVERIVAEIGRISAEEGGRPLALLCYEEDPSQCHRGAFARWFCKKTGYRIRELKADMITTVTLPDQDALF
jgi:hypothetical protein